MSLAKTVEAKTVERRELERLRYWEGQRLPSRDLNDQLAREAELRWWHNRALHDAYGVVRGLLVSGSDDLEVAAGGAYDAFGRELTLREPRIVKPPAGGSSESWFLVLRHRSEPSSGCRQEYDSTDVELRWIAKRRWTPRSGVPLAEGGGGPVFQWLPYPSRPRVRPLARPVLGHGATVPGKTPWRDWTIGDLFVGGIEVSIDTSAVGFTEVPCYFASLYGSLSLPDPGGFAVGRIVRATSDSFTFSLWIYPTEPSSTLPGFDFPEQARRRLSVGWLGVEMRPRGDDESQEMEHGYS